MYARSTAMSTLDVIVTITMLPNSPYTKLDSTPSNHTSLGPDCLYSLINFFMSETFVAIHPHRTHYAHHYRLLFFHTMLDLVDRYSNPIRRLEVVYYS